MLIPTEDFSGNEPNVSECRTKIILTDLYRCLSKNSACKFAFSDCCTSTYCLHPDRPKFQGTAKSDYRRNLWLRKVVSNNKLQR
jgi:hypothetical protein